MLNSLFEREIPNYSADRAARPFEEHGLDSFDLISLRVAVEQRVGYMIDDATWVSLRSPADLLSAFPATVGFETDHASARSISTRHYTIEMPQMAVSGLSESWLFKEIGDFHWNLITKGLNTPSGQMKDGNGNRLYATFTRIQIESSQSLKRYRENDPLTITGRISRYGAGIFMGDFNVSSSGQMTARVMSSFTKRAEAETNKGLLKGQPVIPADCPITVVSEKPQFGEEYRRLRHQTFNDPLFQCEYDINPYHDINGVGLVYFAAYPLISDICELRYIGEGNKWAARSSTVYRDICYFANSDADDTLVYSVVSVEKNEDSIEIRSLISRKSDRTPMALITTRKAIL